MLLSLLFYLQNNKIDLESDNICKKLFIPSFYKNISQAVFKCDKIPIEYKSIFFRLDGIWLEYATVKQKGFKYYFFKKIVKHEFIFFTFSILYTLIIRFNIPKIKYSNRKFYA